MSAPRTIATRPLVLSIGTSEPYAAAGTALDLFIADRLEVRPLAAIVAVSAHAPQHDFLLERLSPELVRAQLACYRELPLAAIRIGAIPGPRQVQEVAAFLRHHPTVPVVFDPAVMTSKGGELLDEETIEMIERELLPSLSLITPNIAEAEVFAGHPIRSLAEMDAAALAIHQRGVQAVLVKGGHLPGAPIDVYFDGQRLVHYEAPRIEGDMRGTGCALAMTIAAALAHGDDLSQAIRAARNVVRILITAARSLGDQRIVA